MSQKPSHLKRAVRVTVNIEPEEWNVEPGAAYRDSLFEAKLAQARISLRGAIEDASK